MNHHFRSYSESGWNNQQAGAVTSTSSKGDTSLAIGDESASNGIIRIHSDSQQSLDRLFNPQINEASNVVPLRQRNLPSSFFKPTPTSVGCALPSASFCM